MNKVYILGGGRSYIGIENSMYRHIPAEILGAKTLKKVVEPYNTEEVDGIIAGNGVGAGGNIARLMMLEAGLPEKIPAVTIDLQCGSGLESLGIAAAKIACGMGDFYIAGGFESSSTAPRRGYYSNHPEYERYGGENGWYRAAKFSPGSHRETAMLEGAENTAKKEKITRQEMNFQVLRSHRLARETREKGILSDIVFSVTEGGDKDEGIRERMTERFLNRLPCVLPDGEVITAGNACLTNDGAAFLVLCSEKYALRHGLTPKAEFIGMAEAGGNPSESPVTAIKAIDKLLYRYHLTGKDIDIFECNEAFAVIDVLFARAYPQMTERYNILGGALAYGHPYGASGGIITLHALKALEQVNGTFGVCSIAAAGGIGTAILIKNRMGKKILSHE